MRNKLSMRLQNIFKAFKKQMYFAMLCNIEY